MTYRFSGISFGSDGIRAGGYDGLTIENGTVQQFAHGIEGGAEGEGVASCPDPADPCGVGIGIAEGDGNVVQSDSVARALVDGIAVVAFDPGSTTTGTVVRANLVRAAGRDDYSVGALGQGTITGTLLSDALALGATDDGFDVHLPGTTLTRDLAFHNGDLGIEAVAGTLDGGGNMAHGNGNPAQCTGVPCG